MTVLSLPDLSQLSLSSGSQKPAARILGKCQKMRQLWQWQGISQGVIVPFLFMIYKSSDCLTFAGGSSALIFGNVFISPWIKKKKTSVCSRKTVCLSGIVTLNSIVVCLMVRGSGAYGWLEEHRARPENLHCTSQRQCMGNKMWPLSPSPNCPSVSTTFLPFPL